jgi:hypothetical protein
MQAICCADMFPVIPPEMHSENIELNLLKIKV